MIPAEDVADYEGLCNENPPKASAVRNDRLKNTNPV
jgi:hypothetical protein